MAWSAPSSVNTGDLITAAQWNQDVVDNVQFLFDERMTLLTSVRNDIGHYDFTSGTSYNDANHNIFLPGSLYDADELVAAYFVYLCSVDNASATGNAKMYEFSGATAIDDSEVTFTNAGLGAFAASGDVLNDANWPAGDAEFEAYTKVDNGAYETRLWSVSLFLVGS